MARLSKLLYKIRSKKVAPYIGGDVLDLGCGQANIYDEFRNEIRFYCGVECDNQLINQLRKKYPECQFIYADLDQNFTDISGKFDIIIMIALIEHIFNLKYLMTQVVRLLKDDGYIIITIPTNFGNDFIHRFGSRLGFFSKVAADDHIVIFNRKRLEILGDEFGLKILEYKKFEFGCNQIVVLCKNC